MPSRPSGPSPVAQLRYGNAFYTIRLRSAGAASAYDGSGLAEKHLLRGVRHRRTERRVDLLRLFVGADRRRAGLDRLEPALQMREVVEVLALALMRHDPGIGSHVGNRVGAGDVSRSARRLLSTP